MNTPTEDQLDKLELFELWVNREMEAATLDESGVKQPDLKAYSSSRAYKESLAQYAAVVAQLAIPRSSFRVVGQLDYARGSAYDTPGMLIEDWGYNVTVDPSFFDWLDESTRRFNCTLDAIAEDWVAFFMDSRCAVVGTAEIDGDPGMLIVPHHPELRVAGQPLGVGLYWEGDYTSTVIDIEAYGRRASTLRFLQAVDVANRSRQVMAADQG